MRLTDYIYPHLDEDPREGCQMIDSTRFSCKKCIQYGIINSDEMRVEPCTICAMANGGAWGWEKTITETLVIHLRQMGAHPGEIVFQTSFQFMMLIQR